MRQVKRKSRLVLAKETLRWLNPSELELAAGGSVRPSDTSTAQSMPYAPPEGGGCAQRFTNDCESIKVCD